MNIVDIFLGHIEAFLRFETAALKKHAMLIFFGLMIPGPLKFLFIFILAMHLLPETVSERKTRFLLSLPFSRSEIFIYSFGFFGDFFCDGSGLGFVRPRQFARFFEIFCFLLVLFRFYVAERAPDRKGNVRSDVSACV